MQRVDAWLVGQICDLRMDDDLAIIGEVKLSGVLVSENGGVSALRTMMLRPFGRYPVVPSVAARF